MVLPFELALVGVVSTFLLSAAAIYAQALTWPAGLVAAGFGSVIVVLAGFPFLALLVLFVAASSLATRYGFEEKSRRNVQEGKRGERGISNVLAHILIPTALVVGAYLDPGALHGATLTLLYTAALAFGAADTFASEFGVLSGQARSIWTGKPVPAGTNGGVSVLGEFWAAVGAIVTALVALALFVIFDRPIPSSGVFVIAAALAGFLACQVDSLLGWTLENRGLLTKGSTNFLAMLSSVAIAYGLLRALPG